MLTISIIAAVAENGTIGLRGQIPWRLPADLRYFKELTVNHTIIMGRKTHESIGKKLPGRENIVLSAHNSGRIAANCSVFHSFDDSLLYLNGVVENDNQEVFVIGGAQVYREALPLAVKLYLTHIHAEVVGDVFFPEWNRGEWEQVWSKEGNPKAPFKHTFTTYTKRQL